MTPKTGDWSASLDVLGQFFYILLVFAAVILLFLIFARWFASARYAGRGKNLRVIESRGVAPQSSVQILQAGERTFLIGVTKDSISILAEITGEIIEPERMGPGCLARLNAGRFEQYLKKFLSGSETGGKEDGT